MSTPATESASHSSADVAAAVSEYVDHHISNADSWHLPLLHLHLPPPLSLHAVMLLVGAAILLVTFLVVYDYRARVPHGLTNLLEVLVQYIRDEICIPAFGKTDGRRLAPLFCSFFFFILCLNLMGLMPFLFSATGNVNVTGGLALIVFLFMTVGGVIKRGPVGFFKAFVPPGVPWPLLIMLTPLEMLGVVIKCFALMIRLVANMIAGHVVVLSLIGLLVTYGIVALPALVLILGVFLLEVFVAFLQAYVFTMLSATFMGHIYHPAH